VPPGKSSSPVAHIDASCSARAVIACQCLGMEQGYAATMLQNKQTTCHHLLH